MSLRPDETIGTYRVVRRIGAGGTAEVFEVEHTVLHSRHALKVLLAQWVENDAIRARFLQEGKIQAEFRHPGLVRVTDTVAEPGIAGLVMDLLEGESVRDRLEREGHIAPREAVEWVIAALDALGEAHAKGIIHRDLKPENLYLEKTPSGDRLRVIDFGIAKGPEGQRTTSRGALGTVAYMSPEQVRDPSKVDVRTDIFALGNVLWELLVGRPAFEGATAFESMQRVVDHAPGPPSARRADVPGWLDDIVEVALRKDPAGRFASAQAFADALRAGARGADLPEAPPPQGSPVRRPVGNTGGTIVLWLLGLLGGALVLGILFVAAMVGLSYYLRPPEIIGVTSISDSCGVLTVDVDARARKDNVSIQVGTTSPVLFPIQGRQTVTHVAKVEPGSTVDIHVSIGSDYDYDTHRVSGEPLSLTLTPPATRSEGAVGRTQIEIGGSCLPPGLTWEARVDGALQSGPLPANGEVWLDTSGLKEGNHLVEVRVVGAGDKTLESQTASFVVGPEPPPGDLDQDGHASIPNGGRDCDDDNPNVHPDMPESSSPNGIDDNCDGRVDEGTVAYDDDGDGLSENDGDCNDADRSVRPGAPELPDCRDQDCDGEIDEGQTLVQREDTYESNDSQQGAYDLKTSLKRRFETDLDIVSASLQDEAWFRFYSQDGDFDDWGIDVVMVGIPAESAYTLEVLDANGQSRGVKQVHADGDELQIRGRWLRDDSGDYYLRVRPERLYAQWCPVRIRLTSR